MSRPLLAVVLALALSPAARASFHDPNGDTFNSDAFMPDVADYSATFDIVAGTTTFTIDFASTISRPSDFLTDALYGFIDLDTDKDATIGGNAAWGADQVGGNSWINAFVGTGDVPGPAIALGDEYFIDLGSEADHAGQVDLFDAFNGTAVAGVPITYTSTGIRFTVALLGKDEGSMNFGILVGSENVVTDRAPNGGIPNATLSAAVPEPTSLALCGLGLLGLYVRYRRRR